jgi:hypothetical protein
MGYPGITPLFSDLLHLVRLFLEKYELLADEDRKLIRGLLWMAANPPLIVSAEEGLEFVKRKEG